MIFAATIVFEIEEGMSHIYPFMINAQNKFEAIGKADRVANKLFPKIYCSIEVSPTNAIVDNVDGVFLDSDNLDNANISYSS